MSTKVYKQITNDINWFAIARRFGKDNYFKYLVYNQYYKHLLNPR